VLRPRRSNKCWRSWARSEAGSAAYEPELNAKGQRLIGLEDVMADQLGAMRGPDERYSDVIPRLVETEGVRPIASSARARHRDVLARGDAGSRTWTPDRRCLLKAACGSDQRRAHWLGHAVEDRDAIAAGPSRKRFGKRSGQLVEASAEVLIIVRHPDVARWVYREIGFQLQTAADIPQRR
jgi:hypothetical protein